MGYTAILPESRNRDLARVGGRSRHEEGAQRRQAPAVFLPNDGTQRCRRAAARQGDAGRDPHEGRGGAVARGVA